MENLAEKGTEIPGLGAYEFAGFWAFDGGNAVLGA